MRHPTEINTAPPHNSIGTGHQSCPVWGSLSSAPAETDDDDEVPLDFSSEDEPDDDDDTVETVSVDEVTAPVVDDTGSVAVDEGSVGEVVGSVVVVSPP